MGGMLLLCITPQLGAPPGLGRAHTGTAAGIIYQEHTATSFNSSQLFSEGQELLYSQFIEVQQRPKSSKVLGVDAG